MCLRFVIKNIDFPGTRVSGLEKPKKSGMQRLWLSQTTLGVDAAACTCQWTKRQRLSLRASASLGNSDPPGVVMDMAYGDSNKSLKDMKTIGARI